MSNCTCLKRVSNGMIAIMINGSCPIHGVAPPMPYHVHTPDAVDVRPEIGDDAPAVTMTLGEARKSGGILDAIARIAKKKGPFA